VAHLSNRSTGGPKHTGIGSFSELKNAPRNLQEKIGAARKNNRVSSPIGSGVELIVGDTGAIWYAHQTDRTQRESFTALYDSLAEPPDHAVQF